MRQNDAIDINHLQTLGLTQKSAETLAASWANLEEQGDEACWKYLIQHILTPNHPFPLHQYLYNLTYANRDPNKNPGPAWFPTPTDLTQSNLAHFIKKLGFNSYHALHEWSHQHKQAFWDAALQTVGFKFQTPYTKILEKNENIISTRWLTNAKLNITDSCFKKRDDSTAILYQREEGELKKISYHELSKLSNQIAHSLIEAQFKAGDAIAINMPMNIEAVAIYLGIIKMGGIVVGIADSFAPPEINTRLTISSAKAMFTQDYFKRGNKKIPLYEKSVESKAPIAIVLAYEENQKPHLLRSEDRAWQDFLVENTTWISKTSDPDDFTNILFSSGTTGIPKAIPWDHTTPMKAACDGYFHQNISQNDIVAWPTNLGWMMGPWLIYATLINQATIALYEGNPNSKLFCEFVAKTGVTILGVVPSLVKAWRTAGHLESVQWNSIRLLTSTGESSNPEDMLYAMAMSGYCPIIEYCGGTEIGGGYITGTVLHPSIPSLFSTPALGCNFILFNENGKESEIGEVGIIPPSIGLSKTLLNQNHKEIYFEHMPLSSKGEILRRHGDYLERFSNGYYRVLGRVDDTMNIGGIKISPLEIERVVNQIPGMIETAAVGVSPPQGGPSQIVIFAVTNSKKYSLPEIKFLMQQKLDSQLNPLFRIYDVILIDSLPRTSSNKVMRRILKDQLRNNTR